MISAIVGITEYQFKLTCFDITCNALLLHSTIVYQEYSLLRVAAKGGISPSPSFTESKALSNLGLSSFEAFL